MKRLVGPLLIKQNECNHRGLKLDGAIGQGEICNSLKSEIFQNPSCPILEKINENYDKKYVCRKPCC